MGTGGTEVRHQIVLTLARPGPLLHLHLDTAPGPSCGVAAVTLVDFIVDKALVLLIRQTLNLLCVTV